MVHLIVQASKYLMIILFMIYTFECFHVFKYEGDVEEQRHIYGVQRGLLFAIHADDRILSDAAGVAFDDDRVVSSAL